VFETYEHKIKEEYVDFGEIVEHIATNDKVSAISLSPIDRLFVCSEEMDDEERVHTEVNIYGEKHHLEIVPNGTINPNRDIIIYADGLTEEDYHGEIAPNDKSVSLAEGLSRLYEYVCERIAFRQCSNPNALYEISQDILEPEAFTKKEGVESSVEGLAEDAAQMMDKKDISIERAVEETAKHSALTRNIPNACILYNQNKPDSFEKHLGDRFTKIRLARACLEEDIKTKLADKGGDAQGPETGGDDQ
jgi:hypothetical protein